MNFGSFHVVYFHFASCKVDEVAKIVIVLFRSEAFCKHRSLSDSDRAGAEAS